MPLTGFMAIGYDVNVDSKDKRKSYGAMVASMDLKKSPNFYSTLSVQSGAEEVKTQISLNVLKALKEYRESHGAFPTRIAFYRSGVGDGQVRQVVENEVKHLIEKLNEAYESNEPGSKARLAFIIVNTRINTRFFAGQNNPVPGTVIDDVVTLPER